MKTTAKTMRRTVVSALAGLALAAASASAQGVNDLILDQFGSPGPNLNSPATGDSFGSGFNYTGSTAGDLGGPSSITWDSTVSSPSNPAGSLKIVIPFAQWASDDNWNNFIIMKDYKIGQDHGDVNLLNYQSLEFDVYVDPASCTNPVAGGKFNNSATQIYTRNSAQGSDTRDLGAFTDRPVDIGLASNYGQWVHYSMPINHGLPQVALVGTLLFLFDGSAGTAPAYDGDFTMWIDNIYLKTNAVAIAPPSVSLPKTAGGLDIMAIDDTDGEWNNEGIMTTSGNETWMGRSGPVTYQMTIAEPANKSGFLTEMFLIPNPQASGGGYGYASIVYYDQNFTEFFIYDNGDGTANATFGWMINGPKDGSDAPVTASLASTNVAGTWSLTFNNNTNVTMTAPDGSSTNFVMDAASAAYFASGVDIYYAASGQGLSKRGSSIRLSNVQAINTPAPINDSFTGPSLAGTWRIATHGLAGAYDRNVFVASATTKYWLNWPYIGSAGYSPILGTNLTAGTWADLPTTNLFVGNPNVNRLLIDSSMLPASSAGFFKLIKREFTQLQVLMPGETSAPGTVSGKVGTPTVQTNYYPYFNVTINAVDANWNIVRGVVDTISLTSATDPNLSVLPSPSVPLVDGSVVVSAAFGTVGANTLTATDTTDGTKTANTGSSTTVNP